jgi:hypothetical protein
MSYVQDGTIMLRVQMVEPSYRSLYQHLIEAHGFEVSNLDLFLSLPGDFPSPTKYDRYED